MANRQAAAGMAAAYAQRFVDRLMPEQPGSLLELAQRARIVSRRKRPALDTADPEGRLDVLILRSADRLAAGRVDPETWRQLRPLLEQAIGDHVPARNLLPLPRPNRAAASRKGR